jgi:hypothetical protein
MQDTLTAAYCENAYATNSYVAPVGEAWRAALTENPNISLHSSDQSHPSYEGSYLAACVFYAVLWNESPIGIYHSAKIDNEEAEFLQSIANDVVFNNLEKWNLKPENIIENIEKKNYNIISSPNDHKVTIENKSESSINVKIFDIKGVLVSEKNISDYDSIEINDSKGVFIVQITEKDSKVQFSEKIIKPLFGFKEELENAPFYVYFNIDSKINLRKVLAEPEKYAPNGIYIMRIHGTFVNFLDLSPVIQQDIIARLDENEDIA